jgi:hypothetical protein
MDFDTEFQRLAGQVMPPDVPVADDLARGRAGVRRTRFTVAGAAVATAGALAGVALLAAPDSGPGGATVPEPAAPSTPAYTEKVLTPVAPEDLPGYQPDNNAVLQQWRDVLAEHLDPGGTHLEKKPSNEQAGGGESGSTSLGTKLAWTVPGEDGMGMVQIAVHSARELAYWECAEPGWSCSDAHAPGDLTAELAEHDGIREVLVEHADDHYVQLTVDTLFGNNSLVPVSGIDLTTPDLLAAAADPRLAFPADVEIVEPSFDVPLGVAQMRALATSLVGSEVTLEVLGNESGSLQAAVSRDGVRQGTLVVRSWPSIGSEAVCQSDVYRACTLRTYDGRTVFLGEFKPRANAGLEGWTVAFEGTAREIRATFTATQGRGTLDRDRVAETVIATRWQE